MPIIYIFFLAELLLLFSQCNFKKIQI